MECPICFNESISTSTDVYKCPECSHIYVDFKGDPIKYHKYLYRKNTFGTRGGVEVDSGKFTHTFHENRKNICIDRIRRIEDLISESNSILDVGAGGGTFLNTLGNLINDKESQEVSEICIDNLKLQGYKVHVGDFIDVDYERKYDLVTCYHVLEHVKDVHLFIKKLESIASKFIVIEVPTDRRIPPPNNSWDGHYHYFSKESLSSLFSENFAILSISNGTQQPCLLLKSKNNYG